MRLTFELFDNGEISYFRQYEHLLVFVCFQELKYLFEESYVVQVKPRAVLRNDILENTGKLGKNRVIFLTKQFMGCIVHLQDDFWPKLQIFRDKLLKEVNRIIRVFLVKKIFVFVLELDINIPQHTQQQFLVKSKIAALNCEVIDPWEVSDLIQQYLSCRAALLKSQVNLNQLRQGKSCMLVILIFGDVDEIVKAEL